MIGEWYWIVAKYQSQTKTCPPTESLHQKDVPIFPLAFQKMQLWESELLLGGAKTEGWLLKSDGVERNRDQQISVCQPF